MPTKNTNIIAARVKDDVIEQLRGRAARRGITVNAWLNWAIADALRPHRRKG